ncbi:MAG: acylphosphatase [Candidatus Pacebacteria bacterium]|jgi:acylphosphatase|nr:acylphosphatase [Candidatus Paceibacterota bacterium]
MQKRLESKIAGRVQMVMFRDFTTRKARALGLVGTVRNNPDSTVSVIAEGEEEKLQELLRLLKKGSVLSRVDEVTEKWSECLGGYKNFDILY